MTYQMSASRLERLSDSNDIGSLGHDSSVAGHVDVTGIDYSDQKILHHQSLFDKFRVQLPLIVLTTTAVQYLAAVAITGSTALHSYIIVSIVATFFTNSLSLLNFRRLRLFPGSRRFKYLLPAFAAPYGGLIALLLWIRPVYSIPLLAIGAGFAIALAWILNSINRRPDSSPLLLIPSARVEQLVAELPGLHHLMCSDPAQIVDKRATIVADLHTELPPQWERAIARAALNGSTIYHVKHVAESLTGRVRIDHLSENSFGTLKPNDLYFTAKSIVDRFLGTILFILAIPIITLAALLICLESKGSPLFRQTRIGFRGRPFTIYKLRTMVQPKTAGGDLRTSAITVANDPRITQCGRFLRASRIDELPQLWNVIKGELSLIGPRPEAAPLSEWYHEQLDFYAYRHVVRPGITGWAQVSQGHVADPALVSRKLQYDFYYIKNFSLWLDLLIIVRTIQVILTGSGAR